ncbi:cyclic dof factor 3-like [Prunus yedoensis var. nudiflora]|uniref:Cyclic dof factor 3-like n=1 Tax=Prunus yedoensis var. nudiflora TaxID=2094558 RepID=A0A314YGD9_PRUYE|nr:cyclic dof factor 3-like [Prunus yedoensis var. nudiflora]
MSVHNSNEVCWVADMPKAAMGEYREMEDPSVKVSCKQDQIFELDKCRENNHHGQILENEGEVDCNPEEDCIASDTDDGKEKAFRKPGKCIPTKALLQELPKILDSRGNNKKSSFRD